MQSIVKCLFNCFQLAYNERNLEFLTSRKWGSLFSDDHLVGILEDDGQRYMNTLWGYIIRKYADIAIPDLECIACKDCLVVVFSNV